MFISLQNDPSTKKKVLSSETLLTFFRNETKKTLSPLELEEVLPLDGKCLVRGGGGGVGVKYSLLLTN